MTRTLLRSIKTATAASVLASALFTGGMAQAENVLNVNMHSDLKIADPIWTTAYMSRNYGYMVYDTLFAMNTKGEVMPQMVDSHTISAVSYTHLTLPTILLV